MVIRVCQTRDASSPPCAGASVAEPFLLEGEAHPLTGRGSACTTIWRVSAPFELLAHERDRGLVRRRALGRRRRNRIARRGRQSRLGFFAERLDRIALGGPFRDVRLVEQLRVTAASMPRAEWAPRGEASVSGLCGRTTGADAGASLDSTSRKISPTEESVIWVLGTALPATTERGPSRGRAADLARRKRPFAAGRPGTGSLLAVAVWPRQRDALSGRSARPDCPGDRPQRDSQATIHPRSKREAPGACAPRVP